MLAALAACNGTAVVTLTATASPDTFLAYRVGLVSVQIQTGSGRTVAKILPSSTTVDLVQLVNLSEVLGAQSVAAGTFKKAIVTLDYSAAQIVYDNGTADGLALTPLGPDGSAVGQVTLTLDLDPSNEFIVTRKSSTRLSLAFNLAASNIVNASQKTVTVMPLMAASAVALDSKLVRIRGPLESVSTANTVFSAGIQPFDFAASGAGSLAITPSNVTTYEINGTPSTGSAGLTQLQGLSSGVMTETFGNFSTSTSSVDDAGTTDTGTTGTTTCSDGTAPETVSGVLTCTDGSTLTTTTDDSSTSSSTTATTVSFAATEVLAGSSVQGSGFDRVSGIVTGRSGNTLTIDDATLLSADGTNSFIFGTATVDIGANTQVTQFGSGSTEANGTQQISVGSLVYAFGTASDAGSSSVTLDASAGRVRIGQTTASGIVTADPSTGTLTLDLSTLGGRSASTFDFLGTGTSASVDASAASYQVSTGALDLTNATVSEPVEVTGYVTAFGQGPPDLSAQTLLDYTTINAELVVDWSGGTAAPFASYDTSQIVLDARNSAIGSRAEIVTGALVVNIVGLGSDPIISPNTSASVFTIGHSVSGTFENFNSYSAYIAQLQAELTGSVLATGFTAAGQYTSSTYTFTASSMTIFLDN
jgi:hypothetical protein